MKLLPTLLVLCIILSACTGPDTKNVGPNQAYYWFTYEGREPIYEDLSFEEKFSRQRERCVHIVQNGIQILTEQTVNPIWRKYQFLRWSFSDSTPASKRPFLGNKRGFG